MHRYKTSFSPIANARSIIGAGDCRYRITILTDGLLRLEWCPSRTFENRASTFAVHRDLPTPTYRHIDREDYLQISTSRFRLTYDKKAFSANGLSIQVLGSMTNYDSIWRFGDLVSDLGGTARTLDEADGRVPLSPAVVSRRGYAVIDDSKSMTFDETGWIGTRSSPEAIDIYVFAYGHDYKAAIRALYALSGQQPLLPRSILGNWWSRFHKYNEEEYLDLMDAFQMRNIPLSVAVLDMDWHLVEQAVCKQAGVSGWTGYTWDRSLFPDPARFGREIHRRGLMLTLNDHPADGVHSFEEPYPVLAEALKHDTADSDPIAFDITDRTFCDAFFDILHRTIEDESGCDFWWIDWQQGIDCKTPGMDPLWVLNHFHYLDNTRPGRHPLTFSRFAGPGSHRYPVGFSGDSIISWDSLEFQPEFTNCASNIGYGWWSHDIGGHMGGKKDDELQTRWVQYGVFSPIMRLHSTANPWNTKEPWRFGAEHAAIQSNFLRLRHKMVPYLQTMNILAAREGGMPLCQPMYWSYPEEDLAYQVPNQYEFGTELIVVPITSRRSSVTGLARVRAWLPPGRYVDIFAGTVYDGGRSLWLHRGLEHYPVLARAGSIIPLDSSEVMGNGCPVPRHIEVILVLGADGRFELLEEIVDAYGITTREAPQTTSIVYSHQTGELTISTPSKQVSGEARTWTIRVLGCAALPTNANVSMNGCALSPPPKAHAIPEHGFKITIENVAEGKVIISVGHAPGPGGPALMPQPYVKRCSDILECAQVDYSLKDKIWTALVSEASRLKHSSHLHGMDMDEMLRNALLEQIHACEA